MTYKLLFLLPICFLASCSILKEKATSDSAHKPNISMVNFPAGITNTLLNVNSTSFTFSVEWPSSMSIPKKLTLLGKQQPDADEWDSLGTLEINPAKKKSVALLLDEPWGPFYPLDVYKTQNKAIFEIPYRALFWCYLGREEEKKTTVKQALFSVQDPVFPQRFLTREEIIQPEPEDDFNKDKDRNRQYAEVDLNDDGLKDIIISDPLYMEGTGGPSWGVYLCVSTNQYKGVGGIGGKILALEDDYYNYGFKRIWSYWHLSGRTGAVQYLYFENGEYKESPSLTVYSNESETLASDYIFGGVSLEFSRTSYDDVPEDDTPSNGKRKSKRMPDKHGFLQVFARDTGVSMDTPTSVSTFYFDLNGDGVKEAIVTVNANSHPEGNIWSVYTVVNGEWVAAKLKRDSQDSVAPISTFYGCCDYFFTMTECGKPPQFAVITDEEVSRVTIDEDGFLIVKKSPPADLFKYVFHGANLWALQRLIPENYSNIPSQKEE